MIKFGKDIDYRMINNMKLCPTEEKVYNFIQEQHLSATNHKKSYPSLALDTILKAKVKIILGVFRMGSIVLQRYNMRGRRGMRR